MKRDMELIRKILFKIEELYRGESIYKLKIDDYEQWIIKEHCKLMYQQGLIEYVNDDDIDNSPFFYVGNLTNDGYDYLEKIRQDTVWNKTKEVITKKGLPMILDVVKKVATDIISSMVEGAVKGMTGL